MTEFPSWIIDEAGQAHWLTDADLPHTNGLRGHAAIEKLRGIQGLHCSGRRGMPEGLRKDLRDGKCNVLASLGTNAALGAVWDLLPFGAVTTVHGDLYLHNTETTSLPKGLQVFGNLDLYDTRVESLPLGLFVDGYLDLRKTPVARLPEGINVRGDLHLEDTPITSLPSVLTVGGSLWLSGSKIERLPAKLTVGRHLDLEGTAVTELPDELVVPGDLIIAGTRITRITGWIEGKVIVSRISK